MFIVGQIKCSWLIPHEQAICFSSLIWLSRNKSVKNLVSREWLRILENFHFSISISKHFDFTFHFSKKSESILISLCTSRKRVKAFFFHFALLEKEWKLFIFTFHFSNFKNPLSLVPALHTVISVMSALLVEGRWVLKCSSFFSFLTSCLVKSFIQGAFFGPALKCICVLCMELVPPN